MTEAPRPDTFTQAELGWAPWLEPLTEQDLTERHRIALVDPARAKSPYFMLLARDPDILLARTKTEGHLLQPRGRPAARRT